MTSLLCGGLLFVTGSAQAWVNVYGNDKTEVFTGNKVVANATSTTVQVGEGEIGAWTLGTGETWGCIEGAQNKSTKDNVTGNTVTIDGAEAQSVVAGGYSWISGVDYYTENECTVSDNIVTLISGSVGNVLNGGVSHSGNAINNKVEIQSGEVGNMVYGGDSDYGSAYNNEVTITGGHVNNSVMGGNGKKEANGNTVNILDGEVYKKIEISSTYVLKIGNTIYGGHADNGTAANNNTVNISGGIVPFNCLYGGYVNNGNVQSVKRTANNNVVNISGGTMGNTIYGGYVYNENRYDHDESEIIGNEVNISGGTFASTNVYAASSFASSNQGHGLDSVIKGNKITITSTSEKAPDLTGASLHGGSKNITALVTGEDANSLDLTNMAVDLTAKTFDTFNVITFGENTATLTTTAGGNLKYTTIDATAITTTDGFEDGERILLATTSEDGFSNYGTAVLNISEALSALGAVGKVAVGTESAVAFNGYSGNIEATKVSIKATEGKNIAGVYYTADGKGLALNADGNVAEATSGTLTISDALKVAEDKVYAGAYAEGEVAATGGTVEVKAAVTGDLYAGYSVSGAVTGNKIVVADGVDLTAAQLHGSNKEVTAQAEAGAENVLDLSAYTADSTVKSADNFDLIKLGTGTTTFGALSKKYLTIKGGALKFADAANAKVAAGESLTLNAVNVTNKITVDGGVLDVETGTVFSGIDLSEVTNSCGAAIQNSNDSTLTVNGGTFINNKAQYFGAIATGTKNTNKSTISNSKFEGNEALGGGALGLMKYTDITDTTFTSNKATSDEDGAGAIFLGAESQVKISGSTFTSNTSTTRGGAISTRKAPQGNNSGAKLDIIDSTFTGNTATTNGGAIDNHFMHSATLNGKENDAVYVSGSTFTQNIAANGGAIYNNDVDNASNKVAMYITGGTFTGNKATSTTGYEGGGAIYNKGILTVVDSIFSGNESSNVGGAIDSLGSADELVISGSTFTGNKAKWFGALNTSTHTAKTEISNSSFVENEAEGAGAIGLFSSATFTNVDFTKNKATLDSDGAGALFLGAESTVVINGGTFDSNTSGTRGGAISTRDSDLGNNKDAKLDITSVTFMNNAAATTGGAIDTYFYRSNSNDAAVYVNNSYFVGNTAANGGAIYNHGESDQGGNKASIAITYANFINNNATEKGGAIYNANAMTITDSTFSGNTVGTGEGKAANDIYNAGTLTFKGDNTLAGGIETTEGSTTTVASGANVTFANDAVLTLGAAITIDAGNMTAAATNFIDTTNYNVLDGAANKITFTNSGVLTMDLDGKTYTTENLTTVNTNFVTGESGTVLFSNGTLQLDKESGETVVVKGEVNGDVGAKEVSISNTSTVVVKENAVTTGETQVVEKLNNYAEIIDGSKDQKTLAEDVSKVTINNGLVPGASALQVGSAGTDGKIALDITNGSTVTLYGGATENASAVVDKNGNNIDTDITINNAVLNVGDEDGKVEEQKMSLESVAVKTDGVVKVNNAVLKVSTLDLDDSSLHVGEGSKVVAGTLTAGSTEGNVRKSYILGVVETGTLEVNEANDSKGKVVIYAGKDDTGSEDNGQAVIKANGISLNGNTFLLDPAWKNNSKITDASSFATNTVNLDGHYIVGQNSVISFGTTDKTEAETMFGESKLDWAQTGVTAAAYLAKSINVAGGSLIVDGQYTSESTSLPAGTNGNVVFGDNSLLMLDGQNYKTNAAITGVTDVTIDSTAKLYLANSKINEEYKILAGTGIDQAWVNDNITGNEFLSYEVVKDGNTYLNVKAVRGSYGFADTLIPNTAVAMTSASDTAAQAYTTNLLDYAYDNTTKHAAMVTELNALGDMSEKLGVMHGQFTVTNLTADAVARHLNLNESGKGKEIWAEGIHTKEDVDGLGLKNLESKYTAQYNGAVVGADLVQSDKFTAGLALTYVDGKVNDGFGSKNEAEYYGGSIYGKMNLAKDAAVLMDISYTHGSNDMSFNSVITGKEITGDQDVDSFSVGARLEKSYQVGQTSFVPHIGGRWLHMAGDSFKNSLGVSYDPDSTDTFIIPLGLSFKASHESKGWKMSLLADGGYQWNKGDTEYSNQVAYNGGKDSIDSVFADDDCWYAGVGLEFAKKNMTVSLGGKHVKGDSVKQNRWFANVSFAF